MSTGLLTEKRGEENEKRHTDFGNFTDVTKDVRCQTLA